MYLFFYFLKFFLLKKTLTYCNEYIYILLIKYLKLNKFELFKIRKTINLVLLNKKKDIFISHIDVVNEGYSAWINGAYNCICYKKKIFCRGIIDMKGGFCAFIFCSKKNNFLLTNDEEKTSIYGVQYLINIFKIRKKKFILFYGGEPTSKNNIGDNVKISRRGSFNFFLVLNGKQKHCAYLGKNIIKFFLNKFFKIKNNIINKNEIFEISNIFSNSSGSNITPINIFTNINYRFLLYKNIIFFKKKIFKIFKKNFFFIKWVFSGIPFYCYKNFFLKIILNSIFLIQNIKTIINFVGGTSDLRYCYYFYKKSNFFELGLINKSIHKTNEFCEFDNIFILYIIYLFFHNGIK